MYIKKQLTIINKISLSFCTILNTVRDIEEENIKYSHE